MSYARFADGSDVYVFLDVGGYYSCCGCIFDAERQFYSTEAIIEHLREHITVGHDVPEDTFAHLAQESEENDAWIANYDGTEW